MGKKEDIKDSIRKSYAGIALKGSDSCASDSSCCCIDASSNSKQLLTNIGYEESDFEGVPDEAKLGLGCGNPILVAALKEGDVVLDLGSGGGIDCFLASKRVGETGYVIGVDMTPEMISLARKNLEKSGYTNMDFRLGEIEHLPVADASVDVIISNCVINLSMDKERVFREAFRVLKPGGRLAIADIVATEKLPQEIKEDPAMISSCIGGAEYVEDLKTMLVSAGFNDIRMVPRDKSKEVISSCATGSNVENLVASYIIEAIK